MTGNPDQILRTGKRCIQIRINNKNHKVTYNFILIQIILSTYAPYTGCIKKNCALFKTTVAYDLLTQP